MNNDNIGVVDNPVTIAHYRFYRIPCNANAETHILQAF